MGCGCFVGLMGLVVPRFTLVVMQVFTDRLAWAFDSFLVGLLGFLLLPYTTVIYALVWAPLGGVSGLGWLLVAAGFLMDLGSYAGGPYGRRYDQARA
jgi:hypothetical protein